MCLLIQDSKTEGTSLFKSVSSFAASYCSFLEASTAEGKHNLEFIILTAVFSVEEMHFSEKEIDLKYIFSDVRSNYGFQVT